MNKVGVSVLNSSSIRGRSAMNKAHFCVGIDVGKDELVVVAEAGTPKAFGTTAVEIKRLARWVRPLGLLPPRE